MKLTIVAITIAVIIFTIGYFINYADALDFKTTACKGEQCFDVHVISMERQDMIDFCKLGDYVLGCHVIRPDENEFPVNTVVLEIGHEFDYSPLGCTIYNHEILHAWGYTETMIQQFFPCGQPSMFVNQTLPHTGFWK